MGKDEKLLLSVMCGYQDNNIRFSDLQNLLCKLEFRERIRGDHHIYTKKGIAEKINIQPERDKVKVYQVKQVRRIILKYNLGGSIHV